MYLCLYERLKLRITAFGISFPQSNYKSQNKIPKIPITASSFPDKILGRKQRFITTISRKIFINFYFLKNFLHSPAFLNICDFDINNDSDIMFIWCAEFKNACCLPSIMSCFFIYKIYYYKINLYYCYSFLSACFCSSTMI